MSLNFKWGGVTPVNSAVAGFSQQLGVHVDLTITEHYGITRAVPFIDVVVNRDNRWYMDPHAIRLTASSSPFGAAAIHCLDTFFETISRGLMSGSARDRAMARDLLTRFTEPWETRFGMARDGFAGHGGAAEVGGKIADALETDLEALLRVAILKYVEHLPVFVEGVDKDITSDITTRIIFGPLAEFTSSVLEAFPEFSAGAHTVEAFRCQVWDPTSSTWTHRQVHLPVVDDKPLLLVPSGWARKDLLMNSRRFYDTSLLSYVQSEQAVVDANGKVLPTPKRVLRTQSGLARGRDTNVTVTARASEAGDNLIDLFRKFVDSRFDDDLAA